ncbi:MAG: DNA-processing protein DprA [Streptosporangiaceae bacterium]|jgi:DNA processing protein
MTPVSEEERLARAALGCLANPGELALGALLRRRPATAIVAAIAAGRHPLADETEPAGLWEPGGPTGSAGLWEPGAVTGSAELAPGGRAGLGRAGLGGAGGPGGGAGLGGLPESGRSRGAAAPGRGSRHDRGGIPGLDRALERWGARLGEVPTAARFDEWRQDGLRLICPGDPEWPTQLDALGDAGPVALWLRGSADLRFACLRSVSIVGARAASAYGSHVGLEMAAALAERGWAIVSGGAFGIDSRAHRGALAADGVTVAVLASGLIYGYPRGHFELFEAIAAQGVLVSEMPPDRRPTRPGFLVRNRVIAALSRGTVVVEAALRSGALSTAARARDLCRPLMAVPGPVTSALSAGCHEIIREWGAVLVTGARDVLEHVSPVGEELAGPRRGPAVPRDDLDPVTRAVLEAVPSRGGSGPASIAVSAGVSLEMAIRSLGSLAAAGFVERTAQGWRARKDR